jgi:hypothetical protein
MGKVEIETISRFGSQVGPLSIFKMTPVEDREPYMLSLQFLGV